MLLVEQVLEGRAEVVNAFPRCVTREGNRRALDVLFRVFDFGDGDWRGIARVDGGELRLRREFAAHDATVRFARELARDRPSCRGPTRPTVAAAPSCGRADPADCRLFGTTCAPTRRSAPAW